jgi:hypothetical protein
MFRLLSCKRVLPVLISTFLLTMSVFAQEKPALDKETTSRALTEQEKPAPTIFSDTPSLATNVARDEKSSSEVKWGAVLRAEKEKPATAETATTAGEPQQQQPAAAAGEGDALRKAAQNPIASLISVPIQNVTSFNIGTTDRIQNVINIQPVIPLKLNENWNLILRVITPIISQPTGPTSGQTAFGFGDINPTFFFAPAKPGKLIWGAGPTVVLPTAASRYLGQGKLSLGPAVVGLVQSGKWTVGILVNNVWSVAGKDDRAAVNQFLLQYFINYNLKKGYYITVQPTNTANWRATGDDRWVVPFGGGIGRIMKLGPQPVNISLQFYGNVVRPPDSSPFKVVFQIAFLYPKKP